MKSLILMNPVRRRRSRRSTRRTGKTVAVRRRARRSVRSNPPRAVSVRRRRLTSPALRRKISLAVKRANRRRSSRPIATRARSIYRGVRRRFSRRRSFAVVRRSSRRRSGGGGMGSLSIKSLFSRENLMLASGAISSSFLTTWLLRTYGSKLPMATTLAGRVGYKLAIPFAGAYIAQKFAKQRHIAQGMIIGGIVMAVNEVIANFNKPAGPVAGVGGYAGYGGPADYASQMIEGMNEGEYYEDPDALGEYFDAPVDPLYSNSPAFPASAFAG